MKTIFAMIGVLAVLAFFLGNGSLRGTLDRFVGGYEQPYEGYGAVSQPQDSAPNSEVGEQPVVQPIPNSDYETGYVPQRVWVAPVYRQVQYGRVLVRPGYYHAGPVQRHKHVGFDLAGIVSAFRK